MRINLLFCLVFMVMVGHVNAQQDTIPQSAIADTLHTDSIAVTHQPTIKKDSAINVKTDTTKKWSPAKKAAILSTILPGAGQAYNKKYWKMPIVYGALAIPVYTFVDNLKWFQRTRFAYNTLFSMMNQHDSSGYESVYPQLKPFVDARDLSGLKNYRSEFRKNVDYSVLAFIALWGLNVMDAAVDGHLRDFNVSV